MIKSDTCLLQFTDQIFTAPSPVPLVDKESHLPTLVSSGVQCDHTPLYRPIQSSDIQCDMLTQHSLGNLDIIGKLPTSLEVLEATNKYLWSRIINCWCVQSYSDEFWMTLTYDKNNQNQHPKNYTHNFLKMRHIRQLKKQNYISFKTIPHLN